VKTAARPYAIGRPEKAAKGQSGKIDASTEVRQSDKERGLTPMAALGPSGRFGKESAIIPFEGRFHKGIITLEALWRNCE
jgi:hypothetical protein